VGIRSAWLLLMWALIAIGSTGCGDSGVHLYAINESSQALIVKFSLDGKSTYAAYELPANASGNTLDTLGPTTWTGTILILDPGCRLVWETAISAGSGGVLISSDRRILWTPAGPRWPREEDPPALLRETTACDEALPS
jgi:hypothetical protein